MTFLVVAVVVADERPALLDSSGWYDKSTLTAEEGDEEAAEAEDDGVSGLDEAAEAEAEAEDEGSAALLAAAGEEAVPFAVSVAAVSVDGAVWMSDWLGGAVSVVAVLGCAI